VSEILDVDREYRQRVAEHSLRRIAPRRFNASGVAWLPILHTHRGPRHYTVLFSNTAQAHKLGKTQDWVVLYADGPDGEHQYTVVTATRGRCAGYRVVRGRNAECDRALPTGRDATSNEPSLHHSAVSP
jgi:putative hydrolase